jgi:hypothetical protein
MTLTESVPMFSLDDMPPILFVQDVPAGGWPPQIVVYDDSPRVRKSDPLTSHAAADSNDVPRSHALVLALFGSHRWLAQFEAEALLSGVLSPSRVRTAFTELELARKLNRTDMTMPTPYGRTAQLWEANR